MDVEVPDPIIKYAPLLVTVDDPGLKEFAESMKSPEEIYLFVRDNIEYSEQYNKQRLAVQVLENRQGDCLGEADLLAALLIAKGYSTDDVVVTMGHVNVMGENRHHAWVEFNNNGIWMVLDATSYLGNYEFIVKNLIFNTYSPSALRSLRALRCLILFTAEGAKDAKISSKPSVFNYNTWDRESYYNNFYLVPYARFNNEYVNIILAKHPPSNSKH
ncbi:MAG: transglutaminase domain-containing protein [Candidatus Methanoperedenaceae archaeon]|nr:transglutaminase domain-containing protein [Candidatus Methanoperedenaceae archaeon]